MHRLYSLAFAAFLVLLLASRLAFAQYDGTGDLKIDKPQDKEDVKPVPAPQGAVVLFNGKDLSDWTDRDGNGPAKWDVVDGVLQGKRGGGDICTKRQFEGDYKLHVEFRIPYEPKNQGQDRGNSGVYVNSHWEVQVLDAYHNDTYKDGMCGAIYSIEPPKENVAKARTVWQSYDIEFQAPKCENGKQVEPGTLTVYWNGVKVHDRTKLTKNRYALRPRRRPLQAGSPDASGSRPPRPVPKYLGNCARGRRGRGGPVVAPVAPVAPVAAGVNTTILGPNVYVFDPEMPAKDVQATATEIFKKMESNQFGSERYALLFKPGTYDVTFKVGFYTQVAGPGQNPDDVVIDGGVNVNAKWEDGMALDNFWRTLENFAIDPSSDIPWDTKKGMTRIAVSQASPLRRLHVKGELQLFDWGSKGNVGYASGGFLADSVVDAKVIPASQQQWLSRNSKWAGWNNAVWNMVFVGCENSPGNTFPKPAYTVVDHTPVIREKPYLYTDKGGKFSVFVPALQTDTKGVSWAKGPTPGKSVSLDDFYVAQPATADAAKLNAALAAGKHILFTPGIYKLDDTLKVTKADTILLGLGVPSLVPTTGKPLISVADVDGVTMAGFILDAGTPKSPTLLEVGPKGSSGNHAANPTFLYDLSVRTGGAFPGSNDVGVLINSSDVVADQIWIWRADHGENVGWTVNPTKNGLVVNGERVTIYGLFNEHHEEYQTIWNGNGGRVYMYQSEMPYDVPEPGRMDERQDRRLCFLQGRPRSDQPRGLGPWNLLLLPRRAGEGQQRHRGPDRARREVARSDHRLAQRQTRQRNRPHRQRPGRPRLCPQARIRATADAQGIRW